MSSAILNELKETKKKLLQVISSFPKEDFNTLPFEGSWTAAQVADHILKSVSGVVDMLYAPTKPTHRDPEKKVGEIRNIFLDFTTKMKSPEFVLPVNTPVDKEIISTTLEHTFSKLINDMQTVDLDKTCTGFQLPVLEEFTRAEWIWFAIYHSQRHTHQLMKIQEVIKGKKPLAK